MSKLFIFGAGGHAVSLLEIVQSSSKYEVDGFVVKDKTELTKKIYNYKIIHESEAFLKPSNHAIIGVGFIFKPNIRKSLFKAINDKGFKIPSIISKNSSLAKNVEIGTGVQIFHNAIVNNECTIGTNAIINSGAIIEHQVQVGDHSHISTGAIINGNTSIGSNTFVGSGAIIRNDIKIGKNCFIGMGAKITSDLKDNSTVK